ncbi:MAG: 4Fe-4S dicluster domain-containing protein [Nitrosomonas sp.]|nr:4Fe-4S dicluster domain-containing protein [Nitrosomonas sp.]MBK7365052.1 4Fe-4S dicluster domain-containing protein [Nitrosomonas sp.]
MSQINFLQKVRIDRAQIDTLFPSLKKRGYSLIGPKISDGAIIYDYLDSIEELPIGWTDEQEAGTYRIKQRGDQALFGYSLGPHSWKKFLFPARKKVWQGQKTSDGNFKTIQEIATQSQRFAFIGVRACELHAIHIQDQVFMNKQYQDAEYTHKRTDNFIVAVNCGQAGKTCFCSSLNTGPKVSQGYDLVLTEIIDDATHYFVVESGSERGLEVLHELSFESVSNSDLEAVERCIENAIGQMSRAIDTTDIKEFLYRNYDNKRWQELEKRCLTCANCTMVCPTCFCSKVEDTTDLTGDYAERWQTWDSCFTMDFSYIHGGSVRVSTQSRYRQWLVHKLASWIDQFGTSGCVGCGRCITWCPVGIDLTEEVKALRLAEWEAINGKS